MAQRLCTGEPLLGNRAEPGKFDEDMTVCSVAGLAAYGFFGDLGADFVVVDDLESKSALEPGIIILG